MIVEVFIFDKTLLAQVIQRKEEKVLSIPVEIENLDFAIIKVEIQWINRIQTQSKT